MSEESELEQSTQQPPATLGPKVAKRLDRQQRVADQNKRREARRPTRTIKEQLEYEGVQIINGKAIPVLEGNDALSLQSRAEGAYSQFFEAAQDKGENSLKDLSDLAREVLEARNNIASQADIWVLLRTYANHKHDYDKAWYNERDQIKPNIEASVAEWVDAYRERDGYYPSAEDAIGEFIQHANSAERAELFYGKSLGDEARLFLQKGCERPVAALDVKLLANAYGVSRDSNEIPDVAALRDSMRARERVLPEVKRAIDDFKEKNPKNYGYDTRTLIDRAEVKTYQQATRFMELYESFNTMSRGWNSPYQPSIENLGKLAQKLPDAPLWVVRTAYKAGVNLDRPGGEIDLFDAAKAWKVSPLIPKKEAVRVGRMEPWKRMVAAGIFEQKARDLGVSYSYEDDGQVRFNYPENERFSGKWGRAGWESQKDVREAFWGELNQALCLGREAALEKYMKDSKGNRRRVLDLFHNERELDSEAVTTLVNNVPANSLMDFDFEAWKAAETAIGEKLGYYREKAPGYAAKLVANFGSEWQQWLEQPLVSQNLDNALRFMPDRKHKLFADIQHGKDFVRILEATADEPGKFSNMVYEDWGRRGHYVAGPDVNPYDLLGLTPQVNQVDLETLRLALRADYPVRNPKSDQDLEHQARMTEGWAIHPLVWPEMASEVTAMSPAQKLVAVGILEKMAQEQGVSNDNDEDYYYKRYSGAHVELLNAESPDTVRVRFKNSDEKARSLQSTELSEWHTNTSLIAQFRERFSSSQSLPLQTQISEYVKDSEYNRLELAVLLANPVRLSQDEITQFSKMPLTEMLAIDFQQHLQSYDAARNAHEYSSNLPMDASAYPSINQLAALTARQKMLFMNAYTPEEALGGG
jgi:hypothetical protein